MLDLEDASRLDSKRELGVRVFEYCADETADAGQADWFAVARCIMMLYCSDFEITAGKFPSLRFRLHVDVTFLLHREDGIESGNRRAKRRFPQENRRHTAAGQNPGAITI